MRQNKVCAICGKDIKGWRRFSLHFELRRKYTRYWSKSSSNLDLYFHEKCICKVSINVKNLWDLLRIMNKLEGN